jgi:hypothetical protein
MSNQVALLPGETPAQALARVSKGGKRSKYGNKRTNGYASKLEAKHAHEFETLKRAGKIRDYLEQVAVKLPGGIRYVCDFMVIDLDWTVRFIESKGTPTRVWINKHKQLAELRPAIFERLEVRRG